jgi:hypothetical protein
MDLGTVLGRGNGAPPAQILGGGRFFSRKKTASMVPTFRVFPSHLA